MMDSLFWNTLVSRELMIVGMQLLKYDLLQFNKLEIAFLTLADIAWKACHLFIPSGAGCKLNWSPKNEIYEVWIFLFFFLTVHWIVAKNPHNEKTLKSILSSIRVKRAILVHIKCQATIRSVWLIDWGKYIRQKSWQQRYIAKEATLSSYMPFSA